ncbi:MAG: hypothetical protein P8H43_03945 [Crocinitomicaceae bacterium]|jgi:hypothetical protein|nr:hypothetical protein [Crocinitomicaceae bacterium]MDG1036134.1 hypothetical protein [Crocinitomicaceae bacterium]MDG1741708.1 hypothetical protein [Crocinitomicaceae bacterium]
MKMKFGFIAMIGLLVVSCTSVQPGTVFYSANIEPFSGTAPIDTLKTILYSNSELTVSYSSKKSQLDYRVPDFYDLSVVIDRKKNKHLILLETSLGLYAKPATLSEATDALSINDSIKAVLTSDTMSILGYLCHKAEIRTSSGTNVVWYTKELGVEFHDLKFLNMNIQVPGFPLSFSGSTDNTLVRFKADSIVTPIQTDTLFSTKIPEGAKLKVD